MLSRTTTAATTQDSKRSAMAGFIVPAISFEIACIMYDRKAESQTESETIRTAGVGPFFDYSKKMLVLLRCMA